MTRFLIALLLLLPAFALKANADVTATFVAMNNTATPFGNPARGWVMWAGGDFVSSYSTPSSDPTNGTAGTATLAQCNVSLASFRTSSISSSFITSLQSRLATIRNLGFKCVLWMYYDFSNAGNDATASQIASHLAQLAPTLKANADVIPYFKAGFIGAWGEWHSSQNGNSCGYNSGSTSCATAQANRITVRNALLSAVHPLTHVMFRYPDDVVQWNPDGLTADRAYRGDRQSRTGFHDDCAMSGGSGTGTWSTGPGGSSGLSQSQKQAYMQKITQFVAFGGETTNGCEAPLSNTCSGSSDSRTYMRAYHMAWFKHGGSSMSTFFNNWTSGGCRNEVDNLLGYRLVLSSISHPSAVTRGDSFDALVRMRNVGWSRFHDGPRKVQLVLSKSDSSDIVCSSRVDLRSLPEQSASDTTIAIPCDIPADRATGPWTAHLRMPDHWPSLAANIKFHIRPANANNGAQQWDAAKAHLTTGTQITVN